jgi:hypothetical protein
MPPADPGALATVPGSSRSSHTLATVALGVLGLCAACGACWRLFDASAHGTGRHEREQDGQAHQQRRDRAGGNPGRPSAPMRRGIVGLCLASRIGETALLAGVQHDNPLAGRWLCWRALVVGTLDPIGRFGSGWILATAGALRNRVFVHLVIVREHAETANDFSQQPRLHKWGFPVAASCEMCWQFLVSRGH